MRSRGKLPAGVPIRVVHRAIKGTFDLQFLEVDAQFVIRSHKWA